jgi:hypothetical protein
MSSSRHAVLLSEKTLTIHARYIYFNRFQYTSLLYRCQDFFENFFVRFLRHFVLFLCGITLLGKELFLYSPYSIRHHKCPF